VSFTPKVAQLIRIALTEEALETIERLATAGDALVHRQPTTDGRFFVWTDKATVEGLGDLRRPGEDYSDVILRLAAMTDDQPSTK
jgi:hypothetical protein